jgi:hypothetical protein
VQAGAGIEMHAKPGAEVRGGEPLFTLHTDEPDRFARAEEALAGAVVIAPEGSRPDLPGPGASSGWLMGAADRRPDQDHRCRAGKVIDEYVGRVYLGRTVRLGVLTCGPPGRLVRGRPRPRTSDEVTARAGWLGWWSSSTAAGSRWPPGRR